MKKIILILIIIGLAIVGYRLFLKKQLRAEIIAAGIEIICYEETNRLSIPLMMSDKKTSNEIENGKQIMVEKWNAVAKKYGYSSFNEFSFAGSKKFNDIEQKEIEIEIEKKVRETCAPDYIY